MLNFVEENKMQVYSLNEKKIDDLKHYKSIEAGGILMGKWGKLFPLNKN
jgi:hypothetical protein